jgi:hypothetical protein
VRLLGPTATTAERVRGLLGAGLSAADVAATSGVSVSALRNWGSGDAQPRNDSAIALDDLRAVVTILLTGGLPAARATGWLTSRNDRFGDDRPIDLLRVNPTAVLSAAHGVVLDAALVDEGDAASVAGDNVVALADRQS